MMVIYINYVNLIHTVSVIADECISSNECISYCWWMHIKQCMHINQDPTKIKTTTIEYNQDLKTTKIKYLFILWALLLMNACDSDYINEIFGLGMNGIREHTWLQIISGHLNMETLKIANADIDIEGNDENVNIITMKVTPSMKNVVYSVYMILMASSGKYVPKLSKCDCPNGWLFCSHTLACLLIIDLIQREEMRLLKILLILCRSQSNPCKGYHSKHLMSLARLEFQSLEAKRVKRRQCLRRATMMRMLYQELPEV